MTVQELMEILKGQTERDDHYLTCQVRVPLDQGSVGPQASVGIKYISGSIDWDHNSLFLGTDRPVSDIVKDKHQYDNIRETLLEYIYDRKNRKVRPDFWSKQFYRAFGKKVDWIESYFDEHKTKKPVFSDTEE